MESKPGTKKVGLIARNLAMDTVQVLFRALQRYSDAQIFAIDELRLAAIPGKWNVFYPKFSLKNLDAVLFRQCTRTPTLLDFRLMVTEHLEKMGVHVVNSYKATRICKNKFSAIQYLQEHGIPTPATRLALTPKAAVRSIKSMRKPVVMKLISGSFGKGVMKIDSNAQAECIMDTLSTLGQMIYFQEYIETQGSDVRAFVVGDEVVAAMQRFATKKDEFRSNITIGGRGKKIELEPEVEELALKSAKVIGAEVAGVDIIVDGSPKVIEVNINPGLRISEITGVDVADKIARYVCGKK
jgi:ribosomal protein S6--L-glutamate ligase